MFGFFNQNSGWRMTGQIINASALVLASYDLLQHPEKVLELVPDLASHALNVYALGEPCDPCLELVTAAMNMIRMGTIYGGVALGGTAVPLVLNLIDAGNHLVTSGILILTSDSAQENEATIALKND